MHQIDGEACHAREPPMKSLPDKAISLAASRELVSWRWGFRQSTCKWALGDLVSAASLRTVREHNET